MMLYQYKSNQMHNTHEIFTAGYLEFLGQLKLPTPSEQTLLNEYLLDFESENILFENTPDGKGNASITLILLFIKFPQVEHKSVSAYNLQVIADFCRDFNMSEGLEPIDETVKEIPNSTLKKNK